MSFFTWSVVMPYKSNITNSTNRKSGVYHHLTLTVKDIER